MPDDVTSCNYPHTKLVKIEFYISPGTRKTRAPPSGCRPLIYLSKYESNLIINKEVMAILAKMWGCGHLLHYLLKMKKKKKKKKNWGGGG